MFAKRCGLMLCAGLVGLPYLAAVADVDEDLSILVIHCLDDISARRSDTTKHRFAHQ